MNIELLNKCYELDIALKENQKLQSNWNSLRDWLLEKAKGKLYFTEYDEILDKMNELEGANNENNNI